MFSPEIVCSEEFLDMPVSSRELYFQLGMRADDDGFIQPKLIVKSIGASDDDLKVLLTKRFLLAFENGVVVIKHWLIHNLIRGDRYKPTRFQDQKKALFIKENKAYTDRLPVGCQNDNHPAPQVRLGKDSISVPLKSGTPSYEVSDEDDSSITETDEEGNERPKKKATQPAHQGARRIQAYFGKKSSEYLGGRQVVVHGYSHIKTLIEQKKVGEENLKKAIDMFFDDSPTDERASNIYIALSAQNINKYLTMA